ncbi:MAG TPA: gephyrin-like molybdotransferase Glp, partial [Candidatus Paceibacterota bacterium]
MLRNAKVLGAVVAPLPEALGRVLSENVKAKLPFPHFDNAAVDGFAVRCAVNGQKKFKFKGEIPAGETRKTFLKPGEAMAIFTGAPAPGGTQAVVMQEHAERKNGSVLLQKPVEALANIRREGEDFKTGDLLISKGTCLEPQHLALLAALGHSKVKIIRSPTAGVFATGNEIVPSGQKLKRGQIYDSNTPLLEALVKKVGAHPVLIAKAEDSLAGIRRAVRKGLRQDVLIVCGGVSVGKYDFVKEALQREGVREIFWKIDIKPGKPVFFGKKGKTLVFGLPGNPVSVFVTFEEFVKPALLQMMGKSPEPSWTEGILMKPFQNGSRPHFLRVRCQKRNDRYEITPLKGQGSHQIGALAKAHGILKAEADEALTLGQKVRIKTI